MIEPIAVYVTDAYGAPAPWATAQLSMYVDLASNARTPPQVVNCGNGWFVCQPTDADGAANVIALLEFQEGVFPRRVAAAVYAPGSPFGLIVLLDETTGELFVGPGTPTFATYCDLAGNARSAPALSALAGSSSFYFYRPSSSDLDVGVLATIAPPTFAAPLTPAVVLSREGIPSTGGVTLPAHDLATFLAGIIALPSPPGGSKTFTYGTGGNMTMGPVRSKDETIQNVHVNVLQTGGPPPQPFLESGGASWKMARVQVTARSQADDFLTGQATAVALLTKAHLAVIAGYTNVLAQETEPNYLGADERGTHRWSFNVEMQFKA